VKALIVLGAAALALAGCATSPARTADNLNRHDPAYRSQACQSARAAANDYAEEVNGRRVVALAGNLVVPFAGTAAAAAMTGIRANEAKALDRRVRSACISDPLRGRMARR
jgi:hypothetical protein